MPYYIVENGQRVGPISDADFQNRVLMGSVASDTYVWQPGMANWVRYGELTPVQMPVAPVAQMAPTGEIGEVGFCCECAKAFALSEMVTIAGATVCAGCKPLLLQRVREGGRPATAMQYAGFWRRFAAKFLDGIIQTCVTTPVSFLMIGSTMFTPGQASEITSGNIAVVILYYLFSFLFPMLYTTFFLGKYGATPGKMALGIHVVRSDGAKITYPRALGRHFAEFISGMILGIGYIMAGFDSEKRALHDHICDTRVVFK